MPRKTKTVTVDLGEGNRDNGRVFFLTEMPAHQAEKWAVRVTILLSNTQLTEAIPDDMLGAGWAALAYGALQSLYKINWTDLEPLLDEMMACIQYVAFHPDHPDRPIYRALNENDIEEVSTRFWLRAELFALHSGFSWADALSTLAPAGNTTSRNTKTSRRRLRQRATAA